MYLEHIRIIIAVINNYWRNLSRGLPGELNSQTMRMRYKHSALPIFIILALISQRQPIDQLNRLSKPRDNE